VAITTSLDGEIADDVHIACADCGHRIGTMGELKQRIADEVLKRSVIRDVAPAKERLRPQ
jgi:DNA-directed RNA polymerase subunit RPC12/RpoP